MGDMADWLQEQGEDALLAHQMGECDYGCAYCRDDPTPRKPRKPKRGAPREGRR